MPAFTFEKLTPPADRASAPPDVKERRGVVVQMLDRFAALRARRLRFFRQKTASNSPQAEPQD